MRKKSSFLHRASYEPKPRRHWLAQRSPIQAGQTAEGQLTIAVPQLRGTIERFVSRIIRSVRKIVRTRPLEALIIWAYVRGLSDRDIENLLDEAGLGHVSRTPASEICKQLRAR